MDRSQLADFLRRRREVLQPEDVGLGRGPRRRAHGLRREEVAALSSMSVDYYSRLEQARGPQPSEQMLAAIARALRLKFAERDHLFLLAGHNTPARLPGSQHVAPGLMRVLDRLHDTPAQIMTDLGETLVQTPPARTLFGDETRFSGQDCSIVHRWFTLPNTRNVYPPEDHGLHSRAFTADLRAASVRPGSASRAAAIVTSLLAASPEFVRLWSAHEITSVHQIEKRVQHRETGVITVQCQLLADLDQNQALLVLTATPGTDSYNKLQLLNVIGNDVTAAP